jgi:hypothetical protein
MVQFYPWSDLTILWALICLVKPLQHLETKSPLDKIYLLEVHAPCFPNKIFEGSLPQTIVSELGKTVVLFKQYTFAVFGTADISLKYMTNLFSIQ